MAKSAHRPDTGRGEWERAFLRAALAQVDATVVAFDPDGEIVLVSGGPAGTGVPVHRGNVRTSLVDIPLVQADGVTPLPASEAPAARVLRGERVSGVVFGIVQGDGTVRFRRASGMPLVDDTGHSLGGLVTMWDITHQRRAEEALRTQAFHDPLTGLPNRSLMLDRLGHALERSRRSRRPVTVLFVDLDRFKVVNDGMGHAAGDHVLVEMARRLTSSVRQTDTVARPGGDEFVVICEDLSESGVLEVAGRLLDAVGHPLEVDGQIVRMTCSIGVAVGDGQAAPEQLLSDADTALYRAKEAGRNRYELFDDQLRRQARRRLTIEQLLVRAIEQRALTLHLQPIVEAVSGRTVGAEALTRVRYGLDGKLLFPSDFLAIADDTGLLADIDAWAIGEACRIAVQWHADRGGEAPYIACNVSRRLVERGDLVSVVESALCHSGLPPALLRLELTEQALLSPSPQGEAALRQLAGRGVRIGLDDFCTGMSSLTHLRQHPVSFLKIDRSIVHELGRSPADVDEALVDAVVRLGHALGLEVIAEGVETEEQAAVLRRLGCRLLQGFLLARPVPSRQARTSRQLVRG